MWLFLGVVDEREEMIESYNCREDRRRVYSKLGVFEDAIECRGREKARVIAAAQGKGDLDFRFVPDQ